MPASSREQLVATIMTAEVLTFSPEVSVRDAMATLVDRGVDAAPVLDENRRVVGLLSTDDLIVQDAQLHFPTVVTLLGGYLELPGSQRRFEEDLRRALGASVGEVMSTKPVTCRAGDTVERAATLMHRHQVSRLPVLAEDEALVGIVSRGDIIRAILNE